MNEDLVPTKEKEKEQVDEGEVNDTKEYMVEVSLLNTHKSGQNE